jgi:hypothetical protein
MQFVFPRNQRNSLLAKLVFSFLLLLKYIKLSTIVVEVQLAGAEDQADERRAGDF